MYAYPNADFGLYLHDTSLHPTDFVQPLRPGSNIDFYSQYAPQGRLAGLIDDAAFSAFAVDWSCNVFMPESLNADDRGGSPYGDKMSFPPEGAGRVSDDTHPVDARDDMVMKVVGGDGANALKYNAISESSFAGTGRFADPGADDFIDLRNLDANINVAGNQSFIRADELTGEAGQLALTWLPSADFTLVTADVDGDGVPDIRIVLYGDFDNFLGV